MDSLTRRTPGRALLCAHLNCAPVGASSSGTSRSARRRLSALTAASCTSSSPGPPNADAISRKGWPLPARLLDLSPMFRCYINGRKPPPEGKGLVGALSHFGLNTAGEKYKDAMRDAHHARAPIQPEGDRAGHRVLLDRRRRDAGAAEVPAGAYASLRHAGHHAALERVRRGFRRDGAQRHSDGHGDRQPVAGRRRMGVRPRCADAHNQSAIRRLCPGQDWAVELQQQTLWGVLRRQGQG